MKVLVVDDNKNNRTHISKMLRVHSYDVLEASNGVEALRLLKNVIPELIISNIGMRGMDGFTLLLRLKKNSITNIIPFVFYTETYVSDEDREFGLSMGASRYLLKPLDPKEFNFEIETTLKEFKAGELKPKRPKKTEEEYLEKYSERISQMLDSGINEIDLEIEKRKNAQKSLQEEIAQRQIGEEKLRSAALYARSLIEASLDPLVTINRDGKITDVNKATEDVTGVRRDQLIGTDFSNYFTEPEKAREGYQEVFLKGFVRDYPLAIRHMSGHTTYVLYNATVYRNERGKVEGVFAAARDITERKHAEELIKLEDRRLQSQLKISLNKPETQNDLMNMALEEVVFLSDSKVGYIYYYSEEKEEFTLHAWSKNVMESCTIQNPQTTYQLKKTGIWGEAVRQRKTIIVNDFQAYNPLKKGYPELHTPLFRFMTLPVFSNGSIVAVVGVGNKETDYNDIDVLQLKQMMESIWLISQRQEAEESMRVAKEAEQRASAVKTDILMKMNHELRTPLNAILGFSDLLNMRLAGELNRMQEKYISTISKSGKHLLGIINDMLDLAKAESGEKLPLSIESFSVQRVIDETLLFVNEKSIQKNIIIKKEIDPELDIISADKIRFKQILLNLLDNALKFSKPQGGKILIAARKAGNMAQFSVSDTGIGIMEENIDKIFTMFYQEESGMHRKYAGTGIGLKIIKQLVEQHGGRLWVESKYGEGSTFYFTMPPVINKEENK